MEFNPGFNQPSDSNPDRCLLDVLLKKKIPWIVHFLMIDSTCSTLHPQIEVYLFCKSLWKMQIPRKNMNNMLISQPDDVNKVYVFIPNDENPLHVTRRSSTASGWPQLLKPNRISTQNPPCEDASKVEAGLKNDVTDDEYSQQNALD